MSIRNKITLIIFITAALIAGVITAISSTFLLSSFDEIEHLAIKKDMSRAEESIKSSLTQQEISLVDWAHWDDTYTFIQGDNPSYEEQNLVDSTLVNLDINLILYLNNDGEIIYTKSIDLKRKESFFNDKIAQQIINHKKLTTHNDSKSIVSGIVKVDEGLMLISSSPIINTQEENIIKGTLIFGRFIDESKITNFEKLTQLPLKVHLFNNSNSPEDVLAAKLDFNENNELAIKHLDKNHVSAYKIIVDVQNNPVGILQVTNVRDVYQNGFRIVIIFIGITYITILVISLVTNLVSKKFLVARFVHLTKQVEEINETQDISLRLDVGKLDEIGRFASVFNSLLDGLSKARENELKSNERELKATEDLKRKLTEIENFNKIMVDRELRVIELKDKIKVLEQKLDNQS